MGPSLLLLPLPSLTLVLAVLPRERLPFRAAILNYGKTCSSYANSRHVSVHMLPPVHVNVPVHRLRCLLCSVAPNTAPQKTLSNLRIRSNLILELCLCSAQLPWVRYCGVRSAMHPLAHLTTEPFLHRFDPTTPLWTHQNQGSPAMSSVPPLAFPTRRCDPHKPCTTVLSTSCTPVNVSKVLLPHAYHLECAIAFFRRS